MKNPIIQARETLGVSEDASPETIRSKYLELVRQFPPESATERFQEIYMANELLSDPVKQAEAIWNYYDRPSVELQAFLESNSAPSMPRLPKLALLALGN
ncbi:J domain-containing protein [Pirellulaceae bacterium SH449]